MMQASKCVKPTADVRAQSGCLAEKPGARMYETNENEFGV